MNGLTPARFQRHVGNGYSHSTDPDFARSVSINILRPNATVTVPGNFVVQKHSTSLTAVGALANCLSGLQKRLMQAVQRA